MVKGREKQTAHSSFLSSPITSPLEAKTITSSLPNVKAKPNSLSLDDSTVDYISMLGIEDRRCRFSPLQGTGEGIEVPVLKNVILNLSLMMICI